MISSSVNTIAFPQACQASSIFGAIQLWHIDEALHSIDVALPEDDIAKIESAYKGNIVKPWNL